MKIAEDNYVEQMQRGNEQALQYFIETHGWIVKSIIHKKLNSSASEQEECMNDVFFAIWQNVGKYDRQKAAFTTWVAAVTRYQILNFIRNRGREIPTEDFNGLDIIGEPDVSTPVFEEEEEQEFRSLLKTLPMKDREIFMKLFWEEKSYEDIEADTGLRKEVLYNRISRGKRKLRKQMEETL